MLALLRQIEKRQAKETARRIRQRMPAVFVYAISAGIGETDPAAIVQSAMAPVKRGRQPAITDLDKARQVLADVDATPAHAVAKLAMRFLALTAIRPSSLASTPWSEFDEIDPDRPIWRISAVGPAHQLVRGAGQLRPERAVVPGRTGDEVLQLVMAR